MANKKYNDFPAGTFDPNKLILQADPVSGALEKTNIVIPPASGKLIYQNPNTIVATTASGFMFYEINLTPLLTPYTYATLEIEYVITSNTVSAARSMPYSIGTASFSWTAAINRFTYFVKFRIIKKGASGAIIYAWFETTGQATILAFQSPTSILWTTDVFFRIFTSDPTANNTSCLYMQVTSYIE